MAFLFVSMMCKVRFRNGAFRILSKVWDSIQLPERSFSCLPLRLTLLEDAIGAQFSLDLNNPAVVFASSSVCAGQATFASGKVFVENGEKHTVAIHDRVKEAATRKY